jgi:hypothetical protein
MKPSQVIFLIGLAVALFAYHIPASWPLIDDDPSRWYNRFMHLGVLCWLWTLYRTINVRYDRWFACVVWCVVWWQVMNVVDEWFGDPYTPKREEYLIALFGLFTGWIKFKKINIALWVKRLRWLRK